MVTGMNVKNRNRVKGVPSKRARVTNRGITHIGNENRAVFGFSKRRNVVVVKDP